MAEASMMGGGGVQRPALGWPAWQLNCGYAHRKFMTDFDEETAVFDGPLILTFGGRMDSLSPLVPLLESIIRANVPLVFIASEVSADVLQTLILNKNRGGLRGATVTATPSRGCSSRDLADIAALSGGRLFETDHDLQNARMDMLGRAERVVISAETTTIFGGGAVTIGRRCFKRLWPLELEAVVVRTPDEQVRGAKPTRPVPSPAAVRKWLQERVASWPDDEPAPSEAADWSAVRSHFGEGLMRRDFRLIRTDETPSEWQRSGRRKPWGKVKSIRDNSAKLPVNSAKLPRQK